MSTQNTDSEELLARLDAMPVTPRIRRVIAVLMLTWFVESFDIGLTGGLIAALKSTWDLSASEVGLIGVSGTLGIVVALIPAGRLADRVGRKTMLVTGVAVFTTATLLSGLAWDLTSLLVLRTIAGLGAGAMFPLPYLMLGEFANRNKRAQFVGWGETLLKFGYAFPSLASVVALSTFDATSAWRIPLIGSGITVLVVPLIWFLVPESPRYLARRGQVDELRRVVEWLGNERVPVRDETMTDPPVSAIDVPDARGGVLELFRPPYLGRTLVAITALTAPFVLWYPVLNYAPTLFRSLGASNTEGLLILAIMMACAGVSAVAMGTCSDRYGRKRVHITAMVVSAVGVVLIGQAQLLPFWLLVLGAALVAVFAFGNAGVPKIYVTEQYPTRLRGTGAATAEMTVRLATGVVLSYFVPSLLLILGVQNLFLAIAGVMVLLILPMAFFGIETAGRSLESTEQETTAQSAVLPSAPTPR